MGWKKLVVIPISFCLVSCNVFYKNYYSINDGGIRPKKPKFSLSKNTSENVLLIDVNSVYINKSYTTDYNKKSLKQEQFFRFFKNGKCFTSGAKHPNFLNPEHQLILEDFNAIREANGVGYFAINENEISVEIFSVGVGENGRYEKEFGYIKGDSIFLYKYNYKNDEFPEPNENNCKIYVRRKVEGLTGTPDW